MTHTKAPITAEDTIRSWAGAVAACDIEAVCYADPLLVFDVVGQLQRERFIAGRGRTSFFLGMAEPGSSRCASFPFTPAATSPLPPASWTAAAPKA
ncbi:hypothetical protein M8037_35770, partial [Sinorhizobium meliloti]|uniref:hypothetical protein n=1 Tax=Rhizobium meliloti TaxID=382 RepID=UPI0020730BC4